MCVLPLERLRGCVEPREQHRQQRRPVMSVFLPERRRGRVEPREQRRQRRRPVVRLLLAEWRRWRAEPREQRQQRRRPPPRALPPEQRRGRAEPQEQRRQQRRPLVRVLPPGQRRRRVVAWARRAAGSAGVVDGGLSLGLSSVLGVALCAWLPCFMISRCFMTSNSNYVVQFRMIRWHSIQYAIILFFSWGYFFSAV